MNRKTKGEIGELAVAARLVKEGWAIAIPYGERQRYDLIAERQGIFIRIQVKYCTPKNGTLRINCSSSNNWSVLKYTKDQIDVIAAYDPKSGKTYFVPAAEMGSATMSLRLTATKNHQVQSVRFAEDYEAFTYSKA